MKIIESIDTLKKIQLDLLLNLHSFCCENNIKYSLAAGTLIGAIRHKGFIPWDDDIDIYLLREDYKKLIDSYPIESDNHCILVSMERDKNWHRPYAKFFDNRTLMIEQTRNQYKGLGVGIDIFPIDDVPDNKSEWEKYNKKRKILRDIGIIKSLKFSKKRSILKTIIALCGQLLLLPISFKTIAKKMDAYSQKNNNKGFSHVYENCLGVYNTEDAWQKNDFSKTFETEFEGHVVRVMSGYHNYLIVVYGNYMQLPPEEKRISHHSFKAYWK